MNDVESVLRETLHDDAWRLDPPRDVSRWVDVAVRRQRRVRAGAASGGLTVLAATAVATALPLRGDPPAPAANVLAASTSPTATAPPELGTVALPARAQEKVQECLRAAEPVREADLLARAGERGHAWVFAGVVRNGRVGQAIFEQGPRGRELLTVSCLPGGVDRRGEAVVKIVQLRREGGRPLGHVVFGSAPPGTRTVVLSGAGRETVRVTTHSAGEAWNDLAFFGAEWDGRGGTTATALDADGNVLATAHEE